jgi:hypothetical protein
MVPAFQPAQNLAFQAGDNGRPRGVGLVLASPSGRVRRRPMVVR